MCDEYQWPTKGEKLFHSDENSFFQDAHIFIKPKYWHQYIEGYRRAGKVLSQYLLGNISYSDKDAIIFPLLYIYRHFIELQMKYFIRNGNQLLHNKKKYPKNHNLMKLWDEWEKIVDEIEQKNTTQGLDILRKLVGEFMEIDQDADAFKYPERRSGESSMSQELPTINIKHLVKVMNKLEVLLDGFNTQIIYLLDVKSDCLALEYEIEQEYKALENEIEQEYYS